MQRRSLFAARGLGLLALLVGCVVTSVTSATAQDGGRVAVIGYLSPVTLELTAPVLAGFRKGLEDHGYIEGQNLRLELRFAEMDFSRLESLAADMIAEGVDVIAATSPPAGRAAMAATKSVPIVVLSAGDPVAQGLAASLARPGGNVTGLSVTWEGGDIAGKWVEYLTIIAPSARRIGILRWPDSSLNTEEPARQAAALLNVDLVVLEADTDAALEIALSRIVDESIDALIVELSPFIWGHRWRIIEFAAERRLPTMYSSSDFVRIGGLMSYGVDLAEVFRYGATYVDRVLKGANPGDLPFERWSKIKLILNSATAEQMGLTIPDLLHARADEVLE